MKPDLSLNDSFDAPGMRSLLTPVVQLGQRCVSPGQTQVQGLAGFPEPMNSRAKTRQHMLLRLKTSLCSRSAWDSARVAYF